MGWVGCLPPRPVRYNLACREIRLRAALRSPIGVKPMSLFLEILRLSMYVTGIARNLYAIWREYKQ